LRVPQEGGKTGVGKRGVSGTGGVTRKRIAKKREKPNHLPGRQVPPKGG